MRPRKKCDFDKMEASECSCDICRGCCARPCWPTPEEAALLVERGLGPRLMLDWWEAEERVYILCPAVKGEEGEKAPEVGTMDVLMGRSALHRGCTFYSEAGCELHACGLKPIEGRLAHHDHRGVGNAVHETVAATWDSDAGRATVAQWAKVEGLEV